MTVVIVSIILRRASGEERRSGSLLTLLCLVIIWWDPRARILTGAGLPGAGGGGPVVSSLTQSHSDQQTGDTPVSVQCLEVWNFRNWKCSLLVRSERSSSHFELCHIVANILHSFLFFEYQRHWEYWGNSEKKDLDPFSWTVWMVPCWWPHPRGAGCSSRPTPTGTQPPTRCGSTTSNTWWTTSSGVSVWKVCSSFDLFYCQFITRQGGMWWTN